MEQVWQCDTLLLLLIVVNNYHYLTSARFYMIYKQEYGFWWVQGRRKKKFWNFQGSFITHTPPLVDNFWIENFTFLSHPINFSLTFPWRDMIMWSLCQVVTWWSGHCTADNVRLIFRRGAEVRGIMSNVILWTIWEEVWHRHEERKSKQTSHSTIFIGDSVGE